MAKLTTWMHSACAKMGGGGSGPQAHSRLVGLPTWPPHQLGPDFGGVPKQMPFWAPTSSPTHHLTLGLSQVLETCVIRPATTPSHTQCVQRQF